MSQTLYTAEEVAARLNLHVKTVRRYMRDGRLKATRIGKEYRITPAALDEFAGTTAAQPVERTRHSLASTIVDIHAISAEESGRITTLIMAGMNARRGHTDHPRVDTIYYEEFGRLRITITAGLALTCELLRMINALAEGGRG